MAAKFVLVTGLSPDVTFTSWRIGQPNDLTPNCMSTDTGDFPNWKDFLCNQTYFYICQGKSILNFNAKNRVTFT